MSADAGARRDLSVPVNVVAGSHPNETVEQSSHQKQRIGNGR